MKKTYESPTTEFVELDTQNVLLDSWTDNNDAGAKEEQGSSKLPIDQKWT